MKYRYVLRTFLAGVMIQVEALWQVGGQRVISSDRDCAGGCWGGDKMQGKALKSDGSGVNGLLGQPSQDFIGCPQFSCPNAHI